MEIRITLNGTAPMLQHNARLSNPLDPYTARMKEFPKKKTEEDLANMMWVEARGSAYETSDGLIGLPVDNVWRCMFDAATAYKLGANIKRALIPLTDIEPIYINGATVQVDDHLKAGNIDTRSVAVNRNRVMRSRPIIYPEWQVTHHFELFTDIVDFGELPRILNRAGRIVGVGDFRPRYGKFIAEVVEVSA